VARIDINAPQSQSGYRAAAGRPLGNQSAVLVPEGWNSDDLKVKAAAFGRDKAGRNTASEVIVSRLSSRHP